MFLSVYVIVFVVPYWQTKVHHVKIIVELCEILTEFSFYACKCMQLYCT